MKNLLLFSSALLLCSLITFSSCTKEELILPLEDIQEDISLKLIPEKTRPFKGLFQNTLWPCSPEEGPEGATCILGEGNATHLGNSIYEASQTISYATGTMQGWGVTFTAANGDQFSGGEYPGYFGFNEDGILYFWGTMTIDEGNGRFEGISGELEYYGECPPEGCWNEYNGWLRY